MSIELMLKNCKTELELRSFAEAQMKTLTTVMKKNKELQDQVEHLKKLVAGAVPIISKDSPLIVGTLEEEIAKREIYKLNEKSLDPECLMLEEAKKLEIYSKILASKVKKEDKDEREVKELDASQLLAIAESTVTDV